MEKIQFSSIDTNKLNKSIKIKIIVKSTKERSKVKYDI